MKLTINFLFCLCHIKDAQPDSNYRTNVRYTVNFAPEISEIISETKRLEPLGYSVPPLAQSVALQEHKFIRYCSCTSLNASIYQTAIALNPLLPRFEGMSMIYRR